MGIDDRNQHDMIRSMPGGLDGVRQMVADFHRRGVRVLFPMMMWDQGTHDPGKSWPDAIAETMKEIDADGINGDTQDGVPLAFTLAADKIGHPLAFEPEGGPSDEALAWNVMTWGQYKFPFTPEVDKFKWLEPRHMVNISDRWARDKTDDLQFAFFNGVGWESWENIWGIWNGITPRDAEATRRVATIERAVAPFLISADWEPLYPMSRLWRLRQPLAPRPAIRSGPSSIATSTTSLKTQMTVPARAACATSISIMASSSPRRPRERTLLSFTIEAHGFGAMLATRIAPRRKNADVDDEHEGDDRRRPLQLTRMSGKCYRRPSSPSRQQSRQRLAWRNDENPRRRFQFQGQGIEIEGFNDIGVDVQYPWEELTAPLSRALHAHRSLLHRQVSRDQRGVQKIPRSDSLPSQRRVELLRDWKNGEYPSGWAEQARHVGLTGGRPRVRRVGGQATAARVGVAVCRAGHRRRTLSLGQFLATPMLSRHRIKGTHDASPDAVNAHPEGASPFGVMDMVGNVWQWTDEYVDDHTRGGILRGGSYYQPQGSIWYFPQAYRNDQHGKLLLMAPSYDRSGTLGFRCAEDTE